MGISLQEETSLEGFTSREKRYVRFCTWAQLPNTGVLGPPGRPPPAFICPNPRFVRVRGARELAALPLEILLL